MELPHAWALIVRDRKILLALGFLLLSTVLLIAALIVGFDMYENIDLSSGVVPGLIIVSCLVLWTVALVIGILEPISGANRVTCEILQKVTRAAHVWPLSGDSSIETFGSRESVGKPESTTSRKMLLAVDNETISFWTVKNRVMTRTIARPISSLQDASAQSDPGAGSPLAMRIRLTLQAEDGSNSEIEFSPRPTTMRLVHEPDAFAATLREFVTQRRTTKPP